MRRARARRPPWIRPTPSPSPPPDQPSSWLLLPTGKRRRKSRGSGVGGDALHRLQEGGGGERLFEHVRASTLEKFPRGRVRGVARHEDEAGGEASMLGGDHAVE